MKKQTRPVRQARGQVLIVVALSLVVLIGAVGLAVDSGLGFIVRAKLNAAVDSASIAAARAVTQGVGQDAQRASAQAAAQKFFAVNFPTGYLGATPTFNNPTITFDGGKVTVDAAATATVPVTLMRVLGFNMLTVSASAETIRKDLDLAFVMDTSGSMSSVGPTVISSAQLFLTQFNPSQDRMALIHFSYGAEVDTPINTVARGFNQAAMNTAIGKYSFSGLTNSSEGVWNARDQLNSIALANRSSLRVIVFFSDGSPNTISSVFKFKTPADCTTPGALVTGDGTTTGTPAGLWLINKQGTTAAGKCNQNTNIVKDLDPAALPLWYNAHNPTNLPALQEFPVITATPRSVTNDTSSNAATWINVNRASRNLLEAMAAKSRAEGMYVFTLGLGSELTAANGPPPSDKGEDILKCMANTPDALSRCVTAGAGQPVGIYCHAATADELKPCFAKLASAILRISM